MSHGASWFLTQILAQFLVADLPAADSNLAITEADGNQPVAQKTWKPTGRQNFPSRRVLLYGKAWTSKTFKTPSEHQAGRNHSWRWFSALREFSLGIENPEVGRFTNIERMAVRPETEVHHVSGLQEFATLAEVPTVGDIAASELDSKLARYLENLMTQGHHNSKGVKLLAAVLHVRPGMETPSQQGLPHVSWRMDKEMVLPVTRPTAAHGFHIDRETDGDPRKQRDGPSSSSAWSSCAQPNHWSLLQTQFLLKPAMWLLAKNGRLAWVLQHKQSPVQHCACSPLRCMRVWVRVRMCTDTQCPLPQHC